MNPFKRMIAGLGAQTAPFGFAPNDPDAAYRAGWGVIGDMGANMLANNQGGVDPFANLGASLQQAKQSSVTRNKEAYTAQRLMEEAAAKKAERERAEARDKWIEEQVKTLSPDQQMLARSYPEKFFGAQIEQMFGAPDLTTDMKNFKLAQENPAFAAHLQQGKGSGEFGLQPVPLADKDGKFAGYGQMSKDGGLFYNGQPLDGTDLRPMDLYSVAQQKASGSLAGKAPEVIVDDYTKKGRPEMANISETLTSLDQARTYLKKGIETGSLAETVQALRSLGAKLGFNVDESVLSNTQAYQNFIGSIVIPRMAALGGNDSNEELRKLYSLSGGDITQSLTALVDTLDFMERLMKKKFSVLKSAEDVALQYLPGLQPIELPGGVGSGGNAVVVDGYTIEEE